MRGCLLFVMVAPVLLLALLLAPFVITAAINDWQLYDFAKQLDRLDRLMPAGSLEIGRSSRVHVYSNGDSCTFTAFRQYELGATDFDSQDFAAALEALRFQHPREPDDSSDADFSYFIHGDLFAVRIDSGPWSPGFDPRCY